MKPIPLTLTLSTALMLCALSGCGGGPTMYEISGTVTYDGQPVEKGQISFVSVDASVAPNAGLIENGKYSLPVSPGQKRVEIRGSRAVPAERQTNPEMGLMYEDFIPAAYNSATTLTADVNADSERVIDFQLTPPE